MGRQSKREIAEQTLGRLSLSERLLLAVSKHPDDVDKTSSYEKPTDQWTIASALETITQAFPDFLERIKSKHVLDYGCGDGFQTIAMAKSGASNVLGVDIEENRLSHGRLLSEETDTQNVNFNNEIEGKFDVIISLNAMEHFIAPEKNLQEMKAALRDEGSILVSFGPLWMAPYGHHMYFFTEAPWVNLLFSEKTVFRIRSLYRDDGATTYEPGLNGMTVAKFHRLIAVTGLTIKHVQYVTVGKLPLISHIPFLREFFITQVDAVITR